MRSDEFEWDDAKAEANLRKHRISFRTASRVFDDVFALIEQDVARTTTKIAISPRGWWKGCS